LVARNPELPEPDQLSGRILVRVPVDMHSALKTEAERQNVSLNHLIVAALAARPWWNTRSPEGTKGRATDNH
jgi:predicted HicB family RNase H-like nuclease